MAKRKITLAIPDSGPLISLAMGNALHLLLLVRPGVGLVVTDIVHFETTALSQRYTDGAQIADFLDQNRDRIAIMPTTIGKLALPEMKRQLLNGEKVQWGEDFGELSIIGFVKSARTFNPGEPTLILIEDDWFEDNTYALPGNMHLVSTSSFLDGLERRGVITSAREIKDLILSKRPGFRADYLVDREAQKIPQGTTWEESFRR
ncbi:MAG: hypothetical protein IPH35_01090 [Rhodoferax sp.]|nr:hypothetical protein [Rhodoferax sp.]